MFFDISLTIWFTIYDTFEAYVVIMIWVTEQIMNAKLAKEKAKKADQRNKGKNGNDIVYNIDFILKF